MSPAEWVATLVPLWVSYGPKIVALVTAALVIWRDGKEVAISAIEPNTFTPDATMDSVIADHLLANGSPVALDELDRRDDEEDA